MSFTGIYKLYSCILSEMQICMIALGLVAS